MRYAQDTTVSVERSKGEIELPQIAIAYQSGKMPVALLEY